MKKNDSSSLRSFHGNHAPYRNVEYRDVYGKTETYKSCYFNPFYKDFFSNTYKKKFQKFDYLFIPSTKDLLPQKVETIQALKTLADLMLDDPQQKLNANIPAGYTYWGQFLDHDITAGTDRSHEFKLTQDNFDPVPPEQVIKDIDNMRTPFFDLDSLYGDQDGPFGAMFRFYDPHDIVKFKIGRNDNSAGIPGSIPNPELGLERDLPRNGDQMFSDEPATFAIIGDSRNDENTIVGQFHLALLKFHNEVVDEIRKAEPELELRELFVKARQEVCYHYQWLILHDFLKRIIDPGIYKELLAEFNDSKRENIFDDFAAGNVFMPLEFSTAAYRFGHTMVRNNYDFNLNFGDAGLNNSDPGEILESASFELLFAFTGKGGQRLKDTDAPTIRTTLPFNWIIEWERFFDTDQVNSAEKRFTRKLDTKLALPLQTMANEDFNLLTKEEQDTVPVGPQQFNQIMGHLARRNLLRGYLLSIPTAQAILTQMADKGKKIKPLSIAELTQNSSDELSQHLQESGFLQKTPLWFYILKEAEVRNNGEQLGPLGSVLVGRVFIAFLKLARKGKQKVYGIPQNWSPSKGIVSASTGQNFNGIMDLLRFAKVAIPKNGPA